jgi:hypothetical protein
VYTVDVSISGYSPLFAPCFAAQPVGPQPRRATSAAQIEGYASGPPIAAGLVVVTGPYYVVTGAIYFAGAVAGDVHPQG